ncbi:Paired box protein Pax-6, partial [Dictyocoela muelleri]
MKNNDLNEYNITDNNNLENVPNQTNKSEFIEHTTENYDRTSNGVPIPNNPINRRCPQTVSSKRETVICLYKSGHEISDISRSIDVKRSTVYNIIKRYNETNSTAHLPKGGDKRSVLSNNVKNKIKEWLDENCLLTLREIVEKIRIMHEINVSLSTVNRAIKDFHYTIKRLSVAPERRNCISTIDIRYQY